MDDHVHVIAEAGVNHNGSLDMAFKLVDVAVAAGADSVKFQTFRADRIISRHAPKAPYQTARTAGDETQLEMIRALELDAAAHRALIDHCGERISFLSTPFDIESVDLLVRELGVSRLKIPSGEITNGPLLLAAARTDKPIILSTGMSTLADIAAALGVLAFGFAKAEGENAGEASLEAFQRAHASADGRRRVGERVHLLHCTTEYPAPLAEVNLRAMDTMAEAFGLPVGYSDHTRGTTVALAAVARGARIIEKHFTLDKTQPGPDHAASLEPDQLHRMVRGIRFVEEALGSAEKTVGPTERRNLEAARKSIVAATDIRRGEVFSAANLTTKRPATGASPMAWWDLLGREASRDYAADEAIEP